MSKHTRFLAVFESALLVDFGTRVSYNALPFFLDLTLLTNYSSGNTVTQNSSDMTRKHGKGSRVPHLVGEASAYSTLS